MRRILAIIALFIISLALQAYIEPQDVTTRDENKDYASGELEVAPGLQPEYAKRTGKL